MAERVRESSVNGLMRMTWFLDCVIQCLTHLKGLSEGDERGKYVLTPEPQDRVSMPVGE
jgi:hypothetical protein